MEHPPYSPDLNPCDYDVFNKIKNPIRGKRFNNASDLEEAVEESIRDANENNKLQGGIKLPYRWRDVSEGGGDYLPPE